MVFQSISVLPYLDRGEYSFWTPSLKMHALITQLTHYSKDQIFLSLLRLWTASFEYFTSVSSVTASQWTWIRLSVSLIWSIWLTDYNKQSNDKWMFETHLLLQIKLVNNDIQSSDQFLENFHNNLTDIDVEPSLFETHSFHRGGVQYLSSEQWWNIQKLCDWEEWSLNYNSLTIVCYLIGWNDNSIRKRENFMNSEFQQEIHCSCCEHSCDCA